MVVIHHWNPSNGDLNPDGLMFIQQGQFTTQLIYTLTMTMTHTNILDRLLASEPCIPTLQKRLHTQRAEF
jgi:hypothetical protein